MTLPTQRDVIREVDGKRLGAILVDYYFPQEMVNVRDAEDFSLRGTPFGVMRAEDLRAWASAFTEAADRMEAASCRP